MVEVRVGYSTVPLPQWPDDVGTAVDGPVVSGPVVTGSLVVTGTLVLEADLVDLIVVELTVDVGFAHPLASLASRRSLICAWKVFPFLSLLLPADTASQIMKPPKFSWQKYSSISGLSWADDTAKSTAKPVLASPKTPIESLAFLLLEPGACRRFNQAS